MTAVDIATDAAPPRTETLPPAAGRISVAGALLVIVPVAVGFLSAARALLEFAYGGDIYGPGGQPWAYGEWVISYASGFVRRGLSGEILIPLIRLTGSPALPFLLVAGLCHALVALAILRRYLPACRTEAVLMLYLPISVLFPLWDYNVAGRKEQLALVLAAALALMSRRGAVAAGTLRGSLAVGMVSLPLMLLHEGLVFFLPLIFALLEIRRPPAPLTETALRFAAMVGPPAALFLLIAATAAPIATSPLFAIVPEYGPGMEAWCRTRGIGSICWLGFETSFVVGYVYNIGFEGFMRAAAIVAATGALVTAVYLRVRNAPVDRRVVALLALGWAGVAPLYFIAFDWGRWSAAIGLLFVLLAPLGAARRIHPAAVIAFAAVMSVFTVSHLQSQSFEIGGPKLAARAVDWFLSDQVPPG